MSKDYHNTDDIDETFTIAARGNKDAVFILDHEESRRKRSFNVFLDPSIESPCAYSYTQEFITDLVVLQLLHQETNRRSVMLSFTSV